jgi:hypothetical protein
MSSILISQDIPDEFLCPITQEMMINPLMSRTGINYEESAIMEWISKHNNTCPMTRQPLRACDLVHNRNLQSKICTWCATNGMEEACKEMPFNADGTCRTDVRNPEQKLFACYVLPSPKSSESKSKKSKRGPLSSVYTSALNLFRSRSIHGTVRMNR